MPLYYFNVIEGELRIPDGEGSELANDWAAIKEAQGSARELLGQMVHAGQSLGGRFIEIQNGEGTVISAVTLRGLLE